MNADQIEYTKVRLLNPKMSAIDLGCTLISGLTTLKCIALSDLVGTMVIGGITLYFGIETVLGYVTDKFFDQELVQVNAQQPYYPSEQSIELIIDDKKGLGYLRDLTAEGMLMEWGTFLFAHPDRTRTIIDYISPHKQQKKKD
ncbi:MAG: hypothetical protein ABIG95_02250 [Candidatus Woesearchaeota archaeon]